jgi:hypothetical protein
VDGKWKQFRRLGCMYPEVPMLVAKFCQLMWKKPGQDKHVEWTSGIEALLVLTLLHVEQANGHHHLEQVTLAKTWTR